MTREELKASCSGCFQVAGQMSRDCNGLASSAAALKEAGFTSVDLLDVAEKTL